MAIKFLDRGGSASQHVIARELLNHRECTLHPNIVQLKEVFLTPHHLGIALEYANGGDLSEFIDERSLRGVSIIGSPNMPFSTRALHPSQSTNGLPIQ